MVWTIKLTDIKNAKQLPKDTGAIDLPIDQVAVKKPGLLGPTVVQLCLHLIWVVTLMLCLITDNMTPLPAPDPNPQSVSSTSWVSLWDNSPYSGRTYHSELVKYPNGTALYVNRTVTPAFWYNSSWCWTTSPDRLPIVSVNMSFSYTDGNTFYSSSATSTPTPSKEVPLLAYCGWIGMCLMESYILVWIVGIVFEALIIGYTMSRIQMNSLLEFVVKVKIGLSVFEILTLIMNTAFIGKYIGFKKSPGNQCMQLYTIKTVVDITVFNWIVLILVILTARRQYKAI
ncbi:unnamed protein product [Oppiella nova]|uniref:Uncharacterized protein n=1 Tax=Oppiella nova TaxID=334625 RepID=A0A7R9QHM5_9ACAR|nr:unnamed protein product [Oppiella nova]CAG2165553.1 unnamed protein product [Oppiella nova]